MPGHTMAEYQAHIARAIVAQFGRRLRMKMREENAVSYVVSIDAEGRDELEIIAFVQAELDSIRMVCVLITVELANLHPAEIESGRTLRVPRLPPESRENGAA